MNVSRSSALSLRTALLRLLGVTVLSAITLLALAVFLYESNTYQPRVEAEVATQLDVVSLNIQSALDFSDRESALESLQTLRQDKRFNSAIIFDKYGDLFAEFHAPGSKEISTLKFDENTAKSQFIGNTYRAHVAISYGGEILGHAVAYYQLPDIWQRLPQYWIMTGVVAGSLIFVAVFLYVAMERFIALPVRKLAERARQISADDTTQNKFVEKSEIYQLENDFDRMLAVLDIRQRRIKEQQSRLQFALGAAQQGVWEFDIRTGIVHWDNYLFELHGVELSNDNNIRFEEFMQVIAANERSKITALFQSAYQEKGYYTIEYSIIHPTRGSRIIQLSGRVEIDEFTGRLVMRGVSRDATERVLQENALRVSESRSRALFEESPVAIATADTDGNVLFFNRRFYETFGYCREQIPTIEKWAELVYPDEWYRTEVLSEWTLRCAEVFEQKKAFRPMDAWLICANGERKCIEFHLAALGDELIVSFIDLTERKQAESEIRALNVDLEARVKERTEELEIANRELESFSYSVSHDLRAPLRAISGFGNALKADYADALDEDGRLYLDRVLLASERMSILIDDLLRFSRLSRTAIARTPVSMTSLFQEVWRELNESNIGNQAEITIDELPACQADRSLLKQVVFNLLNNAAKFSRHCTPPQIHVFASVDGSEVVYGVRDNGVGFNMDYADKLFGVFQRLHRSEEFEGTGVGLALCRRVIERHGGRIWAESSPNQGAVFYFTINQTDVDQTGGKD